MSFLSDLFKGNTGNLGNDLNPSNIFSDTGVDTKKALSNPYVDAGLLVGGTLLTAGLADPALLGFGAADAAADAGGIDALASIGPGAAAATDTADTALGFTTDAGLSSGGLDAITSAAGSGAGTTGAAGGIDAITTGDAVAATAANPLSILPNAASAASTGGTAASPSFFDSLVSGASNSLTKNPLGIGVATAALGYDVLKGNPDSAAEKNLQSTANTLSGQAGALTATGQQLTSYLQNGTLPPGQQAEVTQAVAARKAQIIANAAANGQNPNPTQNSALAQDLAAADQEGLVIAGQLETQLASTGTQLISTGLNATGLSSEIYQALVKIDQTNNNQLMTAIASMAAALGGGTKIQIGGGATAAA